MHSLDLLDMLDLVAMVMLAVLTGSVALDLLVVGVRGKRDKSGERDQDEP